MKDKFMNGLLTVAGKMQSNPVLSAIKDGMIDMMPVTIMGSFCVLFQFIICTHADGYISLANLPGMEWLTMLTPIFSTCNYGCMNFMAIIDCACIAMHFAENIGHVGDRTVPAVAIASFVTLIDTKVVAKAAESGEEVVVSNVVSSSYTSSNGLFVAIIVAILATYIYSKICDSGKVTLKLPDSVPPNVSASFSVLFPAVITLFIISVIGWACGLAGLSVFDVINKLMAPVQKIMTGLPGYLVVVFLMQLLWWFGIHGPNVMSPVTQAFMTTAYAANNALYAAGVPAMAGNSGTLADGTKATYSIICSTFGSTFFSTTGSGITGGLIIAVMLFSKRDDYKAICRLAIPCGIFNINEPIIFGIPMVMNPLLGIPMFLAPIVSVSLGYFLTKIGFCPIMVVDAPWTTPCGLLGFLASGGKLMGAISQLLCFGTSILIYTPFVLAANKQA